MDLSSIHTQQATSSSSSPSHTLPTQQFQQESSIDSPNSLPDSRALRSSARVKAAKLKEQEKDKGKNRNSAEQAPSSSSSLPLDSISTRATLPSSATKFKRSCDTDVKGKTKAKESSDESLSKAIKRYVESIRLQIWVDTHKIVVRNRRATFPNSSPLTINEPVPDPKGKKRALPESNSEDEEIPASASSSSTKRPRIASAYSLRSRTDISTPQTLEMPRKKTSVLKFVMICFF